MLPGIHRKDFKPQKNMMGMVLKVGIPVAVQDGFIQVGFIIITIFANLRGLDDAAAVGIVEKLIGILFLVPSSMLSAVSALSAQNIGAGKPKRARLTLWYAVVIADTFGLIASIYSAIYFRATCWVIYRAANRNSSWRAISSQLCVGLHFCRNSF